MKFEILKIEDWTDPYELEIMRDGADPKDPENLGLIYAYYKVDIQVTNDQGETFVFSLSFEIDIEEYGRRSNGHEMERNTDIEESLCPVDLDEFVEDEQYREIENAALDEVEKLSLKLLEKERAEIRENIIKWFNFHVEFKEDIEGFYKKAEALAIKYRKNLISYEEFTTRAEALLASNTKDID